MHRHVLPPGHLPHARNLSCALALLAVTTLAAGCGAASEAVSAAAHNPTRPSAPAGQGASSTAASGPTQAPAVTAATAPPGNAQPNAQWDLIKSLQVAMGVPHPRQAASALQSWVAAADPLSSTAGMQYSLDGNDTYTVTITFLVQATRCADVQHYIAAYAPTIGGNLLSLTESVQDVTTTYADTQSRLSNLHAEQARLQALYARATALSDILAIEQRLSDVEGQIEATEAELNALSDQVTYYRIALTIEPLAAAPPVSSQPWNPGNTLHDAIQAALALAQDLANALIWLAAFATFVVPTVVVAWLVVRWARRRRSGRRATPRAGAPA